MKLAELCSSSINTMNTSKSSLEINLLMIVPLLLAQRPIYKIAWIDFPVIPKIAWIDFPVIFNFGFTINMVKK